MSFTLGRATERRLLQAAIAVAGLVPVSAGLAGMMFGADMAGGGGVSLDSHVRYLSGLLLGIGLVFWSAIPAIERRTEIVRTLTLFVVLGGLARLAGIFVVGMPDDGMMFGLFMELVVTPLIALWQGRVARRMG